MSNRRKITVPVAAPTFPKSMIRSYIKTVKDILNSGRLTLGKYTELFEHKLASFLGISSSNVVAMSSCTSALHAIMMALKLRSGDEVIVPTYTFASTVNAPMYVGARPILVDSDIDTFNISIDDTLEKISSRTKAIIAVHIGGNPADLKALLDIAQEKKLYLIEDAAHALGATYNNEFCGTFGVASAFSFYPNKIITTGEGGAAVSLDNEISERLRRIRSVGRMGIGPVEITDFGHNFRMSELEAALGYCQMDIIEKLLENRRKVARYYIKRLRKFKGIHVQKTTEGAVSSYYAFIIRLDVNTLGMSRDQVRDLLYSKFGIETTILYKPVHLHEYYRKIFRNIDSLYNSEVLGNSTLALPIYGHMTFKEAKHVMDAIESLMKNEL